MQKNLSLQHRSSFQLRELKIKMDGHNGTTACQEQHFDVRGNIFSSIENFDFSEKKFKENILYIQHRNSTQEMFESAHNGRIPTTWNCWKQFLR